MAHLFPGFDVLFPGGINTRLSFRQSRNALATAGKEKGYFRVDHRFFALASATPSFQREAASFRFYIDCC